MVPMATADDFNMWPPQSVGMRLLTALIELTPVMKMNYCGETLGKYYHLGD